MQENKRKPGPLSSLFEQAAQISKAGAYDIVSQQRDELSAEITRLQEQVRVLREALGTVLSELGQWLDASDDQFGREQNEAYQSGEEALTQTNPTA